MLHRTRCAALFFFFFQAEDGIRDLTVTGVQTCALPYWVSYPDIVLLADGLPVMPFAGMAQGYKITPRQLAAAITPQARLLLLNSPCNPTGAAYTHAELRGLGEVLLEHPRILIGTDDMYEKIHWDPEPFCSLVTAGPELYHPTVT